MSTSPVPNPTLKETVLARFQGQRDYYSKSSAKYKKRHYILKITQILLAGSLPTLLVLKGSSDVCNILAIIFAAFITILEGIQQFAQYPILWYKYRTALERLKRERALFDAGAGMYTDIESEDARLRRFAERVEIIVATETNDFTLEKVKPKSES